MWKQRSRSATWKCSGARDAATSSEPASHDDKDTDEDEDENEDEHEDEDEHEEEGEEEDCRSSRERVWQPGGSGGSHGSAPPSERPTHQRFPAANPILPPLPLVVPVAFRATSSSSS